MTNFVVPSRRLFLRIWFILSLSLLAACAPAHESAWSGNMATGKVASMGPSGSIGP